MVLLTSHQLFKFYLMSGLNSRMKSDVLPGDGKEFQRSLLSSLVSSTLVTTILYPIDLCHTRMSSDMSKKQTLFVDKNIQQSQSQTTEFGFKQKSKAGKQPRLYMNVADCIRKSQLDAKTAQSIGSKR